MISLVSSSDLTRVDVVKQFNCILQYCKEKGI